MKVLLDTNVFIKLTFEPESLPHGKLDAMDHAQRRCLSIASAWEMAIKAALGKIRLPGSVGEFVASRARAFHLELLAVDLEHLTVLERLPLHHRDPFDRLIAAQALAEDLSLITTDGKFAPYGVDVI